MLLIYQKTKMPLTLPNNNEKTKTTMSEIPSQLDIKSWTSRVSMYFYYAYQMKKMKNPSLSINCVFFFFIYKGKLIILLCTFNIKVQI